MEKIIQDLIAKQREYFSSGKTRPTEFRYKTLLNQKNAILRYEQDIIDSMTEDNGKPYFESYMTELVFTINEINFALKNLRKCLKPERVKASFLVYPSKSYIMSEPYGVALIMGHGIFRFSWPFPLWLVQ